MKFKTFGIYTLNNNLYIIMGYENNSIVGFKFKINELNFPLTNKNINDWIIKNNYFSKSNLFLIYDPHIMFKNAAYLGQIDIDSQIPLTYNYARLIMEEK